MTMTNATKEHFSFKTEVNDMLNLVIHSLYSHKDIFLRELISNASDAIDKVRFNALTDKTLLGNNADWKIKLIPDVHRKTLTISDNGCGMTKEELIENIGTIAKSGTKAFLEQMKASKTKNTVDLIGQFGVGFYSAFMVADTVEVITKTAHTPACTWTSKGDGGFDIEEHTKAERGTDVVLHLKSDCLNYLEEYELKEIVKKYSDFVEHPITMDVEREEYPKDKDGKLIEGAKPSKKITEETLNSRKALWLRNKNEIKPEEYNEFYKQLARDFTDPQKTIHYSAEGVIEFKALLFIPAKAPYNLYYPDSIKGVHLYVKRVFIMDDCKHLLPEYLRFIKGVVEASDLPLNVSREILQEDVQLQKIKKNIVGKVLSTLKEMKEKEPDAYRTFYKEFGAVLKEGLHFDFENKEKIADLLLFETTRTVPGTFRSLQEYIDGMPKDQKDIYYITAENRSIALASPHLEMFRTKGYEVLLMTDSVDEWLIGALPKFKEKDLKAVHKGDIDLRDSKEKEEEKKKEQEFGDLLSFIKKDLESDVKEVRFSARLTDSASCLVADEHGMTPAMERMFKAMGQEVPQEKRILELNPKHPIISVLQNKFKTNKDDNELKDYVRLLYEQALLAEGEQLKDPQWFARKLSALMVKAG